MIIDVSFDKIDADIMRIAILSDIHGYAVALEAVLEDIITKYGSVNEYWLLGDYASVGASPLKVLNRIIALPNAIFLRGNGDRYVTEQTYPPPSIQDAKQDISLISQLADVARSFAWTQGMITAGGWMNWFEHLPLEHKVLLPDGTRILAVHASPGKDDGIGLRPNMSNAEVIENFGNVDADLIFVGHVHWAQDRRLKDLRVIDVGAVGSPLSPRLYACYVVLEVAEASHTITFHQVDYDHNAEITALLANKHPSKGHIIKHLNGEIKSPW